MYDDRCWSGTRFDYSKEQVENCYCALDSNDWDLVKAFAVAWCDEDTFGKSPRDYAGFVLMLLQKISAYKITRGRNFESIWKTWQRDTDEMYRVHERMD